MTPTQGFETYRLLLRNQWRTTKRTAKARQGIFMWLVLGVIVSYAVFTLFVLGYYFNRFTVVVMPGIDPVVVVNRYLLAAFLSLFFLRFLFQKTPRMKLGPYLHLPIRKRDLVLFFQTSSLLSIHNVYPMIFFVPFWFRFVRPEYSFVSEWLWLLSIVGILGASHFANLILRSLLRRRAAYFYPLLVLLIVVAIVDETAGYGITETLSSYMFSQILASDAASFSLTVALFVSGAVWSSVLLLGTLRQPMVEGSQASVKRSRFVMPARFGITGQLLYLEVLLMWRNRRPRHYLIVSLMFSTMYLIIMMVTESAYGSIMFDGLIGLFASGGFVLNYGQLMFGWDSTHYDGLLVRNVTFQQIVRAKLLLLQASCLVLFCVSFPLFMWFKPELITLHIAFLLYNAGITTVLVMELATRNAQPVDISQSGSFFNYEGFSAKHWLWFIPTALPPTLFMIAVRDHLVIGFVILASLGFLSLMSTDLWTNYFARSLSSRKYIMAQGFRKNAR
jgi:hypothetical protein